MGIDSDLPIVFADVAGHGGRETSDASAEDDLLFYLQRGSELLQNQKPDEARLALERAHRLAPGSPKAQNLLGLAYFKLGLLEAAKSIYDRMVEQFPKEPTLFVNLGLVLLRQGRLTEAERALQRAIALAPDHVRAHCYLGLVQYRRGDLAAAREHFLKGRAEEFAKKVDQKLARTGGEGGPSADLLRSVAESGFRDLEASAIPFRSVDLTRDERVVRDEDAWEAMVTHDVPGGDPASARSVKESESPASAGGAASSSAEAATAASAAEPAPDSSADLASQANAHSWPEAVLYSERGGSSEAIDGAIEAPGFYAGPNARARLALSERACLRCSAIVAASGELSLEPAMSKLQGRSTGVPFGDPEDPMCVIQGRADVAISVTGLAVALRGVRDLHVAEAGLVGFDHGFDWDNGKVLGMEVISLRGAGSVLLSATSAPLLIAVERETPVYAARDALLAWSDGVRPSPVEGSGAGTGALLRLRGRGYVLVAFPPQRPPNPKEAAMR